VSGRRLTILSVAYPFAPVSADAAGGAEQVLFAVDRALHKEGHRSLVIGCAGSRISGDLIETPSVAADLNENRRRAMHVLVRERITGVLRQEPIDLVHYHGVDCNAYLVPEGPPGLITLHLPPSWYPPEILGPQPANIWFHCVSVSQHAALSGLSYAAERLLPPIENGVDVEALGVGRHARRSFALVLGRICPEKGQHLAIAAAQAAGVPLIIAGALFPYPEHRHYFEIKIRPRLGERVRYYGPVGLVRKRRLLSAARCVLIPSLAPETSSLVAMEALACGTPVIAFRIGALPEIVEHGRTGFLADDEHGMAQAIAASGTIDPNTCRRTSAARFGQKRMTSAYLDRYARLSAQ
jgi:glycosyltransferase involved in cell wall biosynthesis